LLGRWLSKTKFSLGTYGATRQGWSNTKSNLFQDESDDNQDEKDDTPEEDVFEKLNIGVGRCKTIRSNIRSLENCQNAAVMLGLELNGAVEEVNAWRKQCGCSYNPTTKKLQFNKFSHPCYCWDEGCATVNSVVVHMGAQDRDGAARNPICFKKENRS